MRKIVLRQKRIPGLGEVVDSLYTTMPIMSILNFISVNAVLYTTTREYLVGWLPWIKFWHWITAMIILTLALMLLMYIFVLPSLWAFRGRQMNAAEEVKKEVADLLQSWRHWEDQNKN
jgi:membrane protein YdbS with pleckstrin-like domain